ncbi:MAG: FAD-binding oxidoreductase [Candidatus Caldarchaeum sp.]|nr:FAD-binding oxidoreductase [Candidatus Caldarchaeum sp.]
MKDYDVLVVGGGILGLASAYYVKHLNPKLSVAILEKEADVGQGNTARSVGGYRQGIFTSRVNQVLAETSIQAFREMEETGEARLNMKEIGYLILMSRLRFSKVAGVVEEFIKTGKALLISREQLSDCFGLKTSFEDDEEAALMELEDISSGLFAPRCGVLDVDKLVEAFKKRCTSVGVEILTRKRVERLVLEPEKPLGIPSEPRAWQKTRVAGVYLEGEVLRADKLIVAAGSWSAELLDPIGVDCFVKPKKRQLFAVIASNELKNLLESRWDGGRLLPMMFFPNGLYVAPRHDEKSFWVSLTDDVGRAFGHDYEAEPRFYYENVHPVLKKYIPAFADARPYNMWAGCYSMNNLDGNPLVFKFLNCVVATGGSGSGVMKSDAVGRIAEAVLCDKQYAVLHGDVKFDVSIIGVENRRVDKEYFIL